VTGLANDTNSIVRRNFHEPSEMFGTLAYPKGAWVLHMLRAQLGEELYRRCIRTYLERHRYGNVTTEDLRAVIEELSGRSFDQFFDQWLYHAHFPELEVDYAWDELTHLAKVSVRQKQALGERVLLFDFPLPLRFKGKFGAVDRVVEVKDAAGDFFFPLTSQPETVRVDPDFTLLAKTTFQPPTPMLLAQLADPTDVIGRLLAIEELATRGDVESVAKLKQTLNHDAFYGVRLEAARALRSIHTDEALPALLDSGAQADARVRRAVVEAVGGFWRETAGSFLQQSLAREKNPDIQAEAIRQLAAYASPETQALLVKYLHSESPREELAEAAMGALRAQDDPASIPTVLQALQTRQAELPTPVLASGLEALAYLARNEDEKTTVREFLASHLNDARKRVQRSAMTALGTLGDPKAIAPLETFATAAKASPEQIAAEQAVTLLRSDRKPVDDFKNLRSEVMDLQKANRALRHDLDDLKRELEARKPAATASAIKPKR
jgi:aminopeptidase N